jgi:hypothetical protein
MCSFSKYNALESSNNLIKTDGTHRKRLPVGQFVNNVKNRILKNFSTDSNPHVMKNGILEDNINYDKHKYSDEPIIDLPIWTHAYQ